MKLSSLIALALTAVFLIGCTGPDQYPISGEECGPNDPVKDLSVPDCLPE
ncbi:hypothetical protein ACFFUT_10280 [Pseudohalocynthiibacter aestuariivivens]|uniref:Lipoprotein n=1 Tax=Pseudohalocynthiibacter aestuariivivens TaxID=1591409 RepID=A0ABV5JFF5_9RHOB|nr:MULTISPECIES: hypothetical protein [Pseudohalocynthiibacter]MBS9717791.1 hypothetical protein [Pseudohalocynthiibacter aestuariivivens]MCK0103059.1 hypothetical protein [Pseudohalocynthiibacter sp. F2068]